MRGSFVVLATVLVPALLASPVAIADGKAPQSLAERLVEVMGADQRAARAMHSLADARFRDGAIKLEQRECIRLVGREEFTDRLSKLVDRRLKPEEMRDAIAYFSSAVGKKHLEAIELNENVTAEDWIQRRAFLDTAAGYLLVTRALLTNSTEANQAVNLIIRSRFYECEKK